MNNQPIVDEVSAVNGDGTLDTLARYRVEERGWPKVAVYIVGWDETEVKVIDWESEDEDEYECESHIEMVEDVGGMVRVVMVGDGRVHVIDVDDLVKLHEDVCECGQIGCDWA